MYKYILKIPFLILLNDIFRSRIAGSCDKTIFNFLRNHRGVFHKQLNFKKCISISYLGLPSPSDLELPLCHPYVGEFLKLFTCPSITLSFSKLPMDHFGPHRSVPLIRLDPEDSFLLRIQDSRSKWNLISPGAMLPIFVFTNGWGDMKVSKYT